MPCVAPRRADRQPRGAQALLRWLRPTSGPSPICPFHFLYADDARVCVSAYDEEAFICRLVQRKLEET